MSNTNDQNNLFERGQSTRERHARLLELPPLPAATAVGPEVCATMRLYLAVWQDLTPTQMWTVSQHAQLCAQCRNEQQMLERAGNLIRHLPVSQPSAHVDQAVMAALTARRNLRPMPVTPIGIRRTHQRRTRMIGSLVAAAILLLALGFAATNFLFPSQQAFALPATLSWNNYVLFHTQTMAGSQGQHYEVTYYQNMSEHVVNEETVQPGKLDLVVVHDQQKSLGLDMMHHVAQWDVTPMSDDGTWFNLQHLREDLQHGSATYLGKDRFRNQDVYRIRYADGHILLLDMDYMPVNVLSSANSTPLYEKVQWLQPSQVASSMWNMDVPSDFRMGQVRKVS
ncbi:hypothetical protein [Dictyobacter arantiisoli]|nr:hypothetical protein [Dictyobacter arantiisoli]